MKTSVIKADVSAPVTGGMLIARIKLWMQGNDEEGQFKHIMTEPPRGHLGISDSKAFPSRRSTVALLHGQTEIRWRAAHCFTQQGKIKRTLRTYAVFTSNRPQQLCQEHGLLPVSKIINPVCSVFEDWSRRLKWHSGFWDTSSINQSRIVLNKNQLTILCSF